MKKRLQIRLYSLTLYTITLGIPASAQNVESPTISQEKQEQMLAARMRARRQSQGEGIPRDEANRLIQAGRMGDAITLLERSLAPASDEIRPQIEKILDQLRGYRKSRGVATKPLKPGADSQPAQVNATLRAWELQAEHSIISAVGGYGGNWVMAVDDSKGEAPFRAQRIAEAAPFPADWCKQQFKEDFRITGLAGSTSGWLVVMSSPAPYSTQAVVKGAEGNGTGLRPLVGENGHEKPGILG